MNSRAIISVIFSATLAGCAVPEIPLETEARNHIDEVEGVLLIPQSELYVTVPETNPGNIELVGALVAAAIDSARLSSAERAAAPLKERLRGYNFRAVMQEAATDALGNVKSVNVKLPVRLETDNSDSARLVAYERSDASAVLFVNVRYRVESGDLIVTAEAEMFPKKDSLYRFRASPDAADPLDFNSVIYRKTLSHTFGVAEAITIREALSVSASRVKPRASSHEKRTINRRRVDAAQFVDFSI